MNQLKIGRFIKERRKEKNLTQEVLAEKLRVSNRTISKWENGNSIPDYSILNDLCKELDISIDELFKGEKINKNNYKQLEELFKLDKKKRRKRLILILFLVLIFLFLMYKLFIFNFYITRNKSDHQDNTFPYNENISDLTIKNNDNANTTIDDKLHIYIPDNFVLVTDKSKSHFVKDNCNTYINNLDDNKFDSAIIVCNNDYDNIINLDHYEINNSIIPFLDVTSTLKKNKINDVIDIMKYYQKHYKDKLNIFTSTNKLKMYYISKKYIDEVIPTYNSFYYINGDLYGYLLNNSNINYQINIYFEEENQDYSYSISFINNKVEYFNLDNTLEIVKSIKVD